MSTVLAYIPPPPINGVHIGPLLFHFYGLAIAVGVLFAFWLARRRWQQTGREPGEIEVPGIWAVIAGFIGGRLAYVSTHSGDFAGRWLHVLFIWEGGLALYGGLTLGILTGIYVARRRGLPVLLALDAAIPAIPLAQAFGRWGNYFNQELFGTPTKVPWALRVDPQFVPDKYRGLTTFHPTFLYESLWDLVIVGTLLWLGARRKLRTGSIVLCYLAMYAFGRFLLELIRTDTTFRLFGLSRNAYVSLAVVIGAGVWLALRERGGPAGEPGGLGAEGASVPGGPGDPDGPDGTDREPATVAAGHAGASSAQGPGTAGPQAPDGGPAAGSASGGTAEPDEGPAEKPTTTEEPTATGKAGGEPTPADSAAKPDGAAAERPDGPGEPEAPGKPEDPDPAA